MVHTVTHIRPSVVQRINFSFLWAHQLLRHFVSEISRREKFSCSGIGFLVGLGHTRLSRGISYIFIFWRHSNIRGECSLRHRASINRITLSFPFWFCVLIWSRRYVSFIPQEIHRDVGEVWLHFLIHLRNNHLVLCILATWIKFVLQLRTFDSVERWLSKWLRVSICLVKLFIALLFCRLKCGLRPQLLSILLNSHCNGVFY